jgi:hypothetical protein
MFRPLFGHHQVYNLCLGEVYFIMDPYFEYDYITCNKTLGSIYFLV